MTTISKKKAKPASTSPKAKKAKAKPRQKTVQQIKAEADAKAAKEAEKEAVKAEKEQARIKSLADSDFAKYNRPTDTTVPWSQISAPGMGSGRQTRDLVFDHKYDEKVLYILANGTTIEPLDVRRVSENKYEVFAGVHRHAAYGEAAKKLRDAGRGEEADALLADIRVRVWDITINEQLQLGFLSNNSSRIMTKLEQAMAVATFLSRKENQGLTSTAAASKFGLKLGTFRNMVALTQLTPKLQKAVFNDQTVPISVGYAIGHLPADEQDEWEEMVHKGDIHDVIKAVQGRIRDIKEGAEVGTARAKEKAQAAIEGPKMMRKKEVEEMLSELIEADAKVIGEISLQAQSVAIDTLRKVLGIGEVNGTHWMPGFQGATETAVERDLDGRIA